ncbi:hypothetical protein HYT95_03520, partial [Candidatus Peregrinibacteria bacterium]|nr:hypothetical protein [Candidatus Peregrinibacteria bacterium]
SETLVERVQFIENQVALSAYTKKPIFGPASLTVRQSSFDGNGKKTDMLNGSAITIE